MVKKYAYALICGVGFLSLIRTYLILFTSYLPDFSIYYVATLDLVKKINPYTDTHLFTQFNYPPIATLLFLPLTYFSYTIASQIFLTLSIASYILSFIVLYKLQPKHKNKLLVLFLLFSISFPLKFTLGMGQINTVLLLAITACVYFCSKRKDLLAAIFLVFAVVLKLFPVLLIVPFLVLRRYKTVVYTLIFLFAAIIIQQILFDQSFITYYYRSVLIPLLKSPAGPVYYNQSLSGAFARFQLPLYLFTFVRVAIVTATIVVAPEKRRNTLLVFSHMLVAILLINSFTWQHHLVLLVPAFYAVFITASSKKEWAAIAVSYVLISANIKNPNAFAHYWYGAVLLSHASFGMLMLWTLLLFQKPKKNI